MRAGQLRGLPAAKGTQFARWPTKMRAVNLTVVCALAIVA